MCIYIYVHMYVCIYIYRHIYIRTYIHTISLLRRTHLLDLSSLAEAPDYLLVVENI